MVVEGAPGIGKSSLMGEAAELAQAGGMAVLRARGGVMEREFALGVVIQLLAPCIEPLAGRERERAFAGAAGLARPLFEQVPDRAAADDRLFARFHGLHWLCARLAEERPLAMFVDDAHWADEQSIRFLAYLAARIDEIPACAILAVRTGEAASAPDALTELLLEREPLAAVRPPPLSPAAVAELVRGSLGEETGDAVCAECARTTGGNPLLVRQLIAALEERGREPGRLDARAIAAIGPPSVARFVAARLSRRSPKVAAVARALAIVGDDASLAETAAVAAVDRPAAARAVDELIDAELVHPRLPPRFVHPIIHQALLDSIPPAERTQLHLVAARELARDPARQERAAAHLLAAGPAGPVGERWAFDALTTAARRVGDRGSAEPCGAVPAPGARRGGPGAAPAVAAARARRSRVGRPHARGGRAHGAGATPVEQSGRTGERGARPLDGALPRRRAAAGRRRLRGHARRGRRPRIASCAWDSSSRRPRRAWSAGFPAPRRSSGCWRSSTR